MSDTEEAALRDELLEASVPVADTKAEPPKRNSKQGLIDKIVELSEKEGIPLEYSNTSLKRMNKKQLSSLLAEPFAENSRGL